MTDENLTALINRANGYPGPQIVFTRPLIANVHLAKAWLAEPSPTQRVSGSFSGYDLYLIQNSAGVFVGVVLDMENDLHWLVRRPFRGQGWLTTALREVILPHLLQTRAQQTICISISCGLDVADRQASERVAADVGFVLLEAGADEHTFVYQPAEPPAEVPAPAPVMPTMTEERLEGLRQQLAYHAASLRLLQAEVAWTLADDSVSDALGDLAEDVQAQADYLERQWFGKSPLATS